MQKWQGHKTDSISMDDENEYKNVKEVTEVKDNDEQENMRIIENVISFSLTSSTLYFFSLFKMPVLDSIYTSSHSFIRWNL